MQDHSESFASQDRSLKEQGGKVSTPSVIGAARALPPRPAATQRGAIAAAQARLRTLDLNELREAYRTVSASAGSIGTAEAQAALQLDRTLIRQEIRRRGISLYDLFSAAELGVKE